jgi:hypothetical protein
MAKYTIEMWTRSKEKVTIHTDSDAEMRELEILPFDDESNIAATHINH